jgi:aspartate ammonia-lyase
MNDRKTPRWGDQTAAAIVNFGRGQTPRAFIQALGEVKEAALRALQETEEPWSPGVYEAALEALKEIREGLYDGEFPLDLAQGGAGTSLHMNICEVLSALVEEKAGPTARFHPLDDGARSQSTNDVVTTAVIVVVQRLIRRVEASVIALQEALVAREAAWRGTLVTGRTEWQAALPMDLSLVASAWAGSAERDRWRLGKLKERTRTVPLGGTAVGTGSGAPGAYLFAAERQLRLITGLPLQRSQNLSDAVAQRDDLAEVAQVFKVVAANLVKLCRDLFFYTASSVGELVLPQLQWGSTAMPVKNNPVLVEFASGLAIRCQGACDTVLRYTEEGFLQLNAYGPFMLSGLLGASHDLGNALDTLSTGLLPRLGVDPLRSFRNLAQSSAPLNALRPELPYGFLKTLMEGTSGADIPAEEEKKENALGMEEEALVRRLSEITGLQGAVIRRRLGLRSTVAAENEGSIVKE